MAEKQQETRGGEREGAGRKPRFANSDQFLTQLVDALDKKATATGESAADRLVAIAYSEDKREAGPVLRFIFDKMITAASERMSEVTQPRGPTIYLPQKRPDPAKVVPIKAAG